MLYSRTHSQHCVIVLRTSKSANVFYYCVTYPALGFDVLHLMVRVLAYCLTAPQFDADLEVGVTHCANRQEVDQNCQEDIVSRVGTSHNTKLIIINTCTHTTRESQIDTIENVVPTSSVEKSLTD